MSVLHHKKATPLPRNSFTEAELDAGINFVMSDMTLDAYNEIVGTPKPQTWAGIGLTSKNPIGLFRHA